MASWALQDACVAARARPADMGCFPAPQTPNQASSSLGLVVLAEDTHKTLLAHRICTDNDIYHRQGEGAAIWLGARPLPRPGPYAAPLPRR